MDHAEVVAFLQRRYGMATTDVGRLDGGEINELWRADTSHGRVVLRLHKEAQDHDHVSYIHAAQVALSERLAFVPAPRVGLDGRTLQQFDGQIVTVFPYVDGVHADLARPADRLAAAEAVGRLHHEAADIGFSLAPGWNREAGPAVYFEWTHRVRDALVHRRGRFGLDRATHEQLIALFDQEVADLDRWCRTSLAALPTGLIHGDLNHRNILIRDGRVVGLLDWDTSRVGFYAWDLATILGGDIDPDTVSAYASAGGPSPVPDRETLVNLARVQNENELMWIFADNATSDELEADAGTTIRRVAHRQRYLRQLASGQAV